MRFASDVHAARTHIAPAKVIVPRGASRIYGGECTSRDIEIIAK